MDRKEKIFPQPSFVYLSFFHLSFIYLSVLIYLSIGDLVSFFSSSGIFSEVVKLLLSIRFSLSQCLSFSRSFFRRLLNHSEILLRYLVSLKKNFLEVSRSRTVLWRKEREMEQRKRERDDRSVSLIAEREKKRDKRDSWGVHQRKSYLSRFLSLWRSSLRSSSRRKKREGGWHRQADMKEH